MTQSTKIFYAWRCDKKGMPIAYCRAPTLVEIEAWLDGKEPNVDIKPTDRSESADEINLLAEAIDKALDLSHSQDEMVKLTSFLGDVIISNTIQKELINPIKERGNIVREEGNVTIYELDICNTHFIRPASQKIKHMELGFSVLPQSVFLGIIAKFDSLISEYIKLMLKMGKNRFTEGQTSVKISEISHLSNVSEIIDFVIEREVYELMRGSHQDQVKYIEDNFHIKIIKEWKRYPDFIELFERRNLIAHGEQYFTKLYHTKCKEAKHNQKDDMIGQKISVTPNYMNQSLDLILEFIILLLFQFWRKRFPEKSNEAFSFLNHKIYYLIGKRRYKVAQWIADFALGLKIKVPDVTRRMLIINLASAYLHDGDEKACERIISEEDWTACSENFRICVASLKRDVPQVCELLPIIANSQSVEKQDLRDWPVFDFVKQDPIFLEKFEEVFGEKFELTDLRDEVTQVEPDTPRLTPSTKLH